MRLQQIVGQGVTLFFKGVQGLGYSKFSGYLSGLKLSFEVCNSSIFDGGRLLQLVGQFGLCELDGVDFFLLRKCQSIMQLLIELAVADLLEDVRITGLVNLEGFGAVGADDFVHINFLIGKHL